MTNEIKILFIILTFILLIFLLIGCSEAEKGYQEHGWAKVISGTDGRMSFQFYQPATLTQREIDSLDNLSDTLYFENLGCLYFMYRDKNGDVVRDSRGIEYRIPNKIKLKFK